MKSINIVCSAAETLNIPTTTSTNRSSSLTKPQTAKGADSGRLSHSMLQLLVHSYKLQPGAPQAMTTFSVAAARHSYHKRW